MNRNGNPAGGKPASRFWPVLRIPLSTVAAQGSDPEDDRSRDPVLPELPVGYANERAIDLLEKAATSLDNRTKDREGRGVEGTHRE